jgi:Acetyltransferase (GNAT) domain
MIRPLERRDLPDVARLYELVMRAGAEAPPPFLESFFARTLLDYPWADDEIPSLVYEEGGKILGALGSNVRKMRFDGRPIRMACAAHLVTHPRVRNRVVGPQLLRTYLAGPQELTITDGASETVRRMWLAFGGQTVHVCALVFIRVLRPWQLAREALLGGRGGPMLDRLGSRLAGAVDTTTAPLVRRALPLARPPAATVEPLSPETLLAHLPEITASRRLVPDYDLSYLRWLFAELNRVQSWGSLWPHGVGVRRGVLFAELVRRDTQVLGWYVCHLRRGGVCRIVQVAAGDGSSAQLLDQLTYEAARRGAAGLFGRIEPHLVGPLSERPCLIRFGGGRLLVHSREQAIVDVILAGDALLTRLEGEWW